MDVCVTLELLGYIAAATQHMHMECVLQLTEKNLLDWGSTAGEVLGLKSRF